MLKRITVLEVPSGVCLFDKTWAWHSTEGEGRGSADGICSMVMTLGKLAKDLGAPDGSPTPSVLFDTGARVLAPSQKRKSRKPRTPIPGTSAAGLPPQHRHAESTMPAPPASSPASSSVTALAPHAPVRLAYVRHGTIAVAVFHDSEDDAAVSKLLAVAVSRFEEIFGGVVVAMRPRFEQCERSQDGKARMSQDELRPFQEFERIADGIRADFK